MHVQVGPGGRGALVVRDGQGTRSEEGGLPPPWPYQGSQQPRRLRWAGRVVSLWPRIVLETVERVGVGGDRPPGV